MIQGCRFVNFAKTVKIKFKLSLVFFVDKGPVLKCSVQEFPILFFKKVYYVCGERVCLNEVTFFLISLVNYEERVLGLYPHSQINLLENGCEFWRRIFRFSWGVCSVN